MPILSKLRMPPAKIVNGNLTQVETYIGFHQVRYMVHVQLTICSASDGPDTIVSRIAFSIESGVGLGQPYESKG